MLESFLLLKWDATDVYWEYAGKTKSATKSYVRGQKKTVDGNGLDKAKETQTFWSHLQNGRQKTHQDRDARNGERQQATRKTGKEVVRRHCRLVWMLTSRGSSAGKRPTIVETSHWPQRLTWAMSWWWWWWCWPKPYCMLNSISTTLRCRCDSPHAHSNSTTCDQRLNLQLESNINYCNLKPLRQPMNERTNEWMSVLIFKPLSFFLWYLHLQFPVNSSSVSVEFHPPHVIVSNRSISSVFNSMQLMRLSPSTVCVAVSRWQQNAAQIRVHNNLPNRN